MIAYDPRWRRWLILPALGFFFLLSACSQETGRSTAAAIPTALPSRTPAATQPGRASPSPTAVSPPAAAAPASPTTRPTTVARPTSPPTLTPTPVVLTFAAVGDYGWFGPAAREVAALVDEQDPDLVLTLGDNNYPDGAANTIEGNITAITAVL